VIEGLEALQLLLPALDLVLELAEAAEYFFRPSCASRASGARFVLREGGDEVLARHAGIGTAMTMISFSSGARQ